MRDSLDDKVQALPPLDDSYLTKLSLRALFNRYLLIDAPELVCGLHALHVAIFTKIFLRCLVRITDKYNLTDNDIEAISIAASLHDVGKAYISSKIITGTEKLTEDQSDIVKFHPLAGAAILDYAYEITDPLILEYAKQICRWHHERNDGSGYPDHLLYDQIPIAAQVVSIVDCYDALTSDRSYAIARSHSKAVAMICSGQCGEFSDVMLECLIECSDELKKAHDVANKAAENMTVEKLSTILCNMYKDKILLK